MTRLYFAAALSIRAIARSLGTSLSTVGDYLRRHKVAGLSWFVPESVDDAGLERWLFPEPPLSRTARPLSDRSEVHRELRRKSVTLLLLWQEYKVIHPEGLQYTRFCEQYRAWAAKLDLVMGHEHRAGEKLFVDYAGQTVPVVDRETVGERRRRSSWPCSAPRATPSPRRRGRRPCRTGRRRTCAPSSSSAGVPGLVIPDNLRSRSPRRSSWRLRCCGGVRTFRKTT